MKANRALLLILHMENQVIMSSWLVVLVGYIFGGPHLKIWIE